MPTSNNGWPVIPSSTSADLTTIRAGGYTLTVRAGTPAAIFSSFIPKYIAQVEALTSQPWGYSYRMNVNNTSLWSCHASGTAIDLNAPKHPNGLPASATFNSAQLAAARKLASEYAGQLRWLETTDPMHWEISAAPGAAVATAGSATDAAGGATGAAGGTLGLAAGLDLTGVASFFAALTSPDMWIRLAEGMIGILLIITGMVIVFRKPLTDSVIGKVLP